MNTVHLSAVYCSQVVTNPANVTFMQLFTNILGVIHSFLHSFTCFLLPHSNFHSLVHSFKLKMFNSISCEATYRFQYCTHSHTHKEKKTKEKKKNSKSTHRSAYFALIPNFNLLPLCINNYLNCNLAAPCLYICVFFSSFCSFLDGFHRSSCHLVYLGSSLA